MSKRTRREKSIVWHYTTGQCFIGIIESGVIRPATGQVPAGERPIVWFSSNQEWEPTSTKLYVTNEGSVRRLSKEELEKRGNGLVRFGVTRRTAKLDWTARNFSAECHGALRGISRSQAEGLDPSRNGGSAVSTPFSAPSGLQSRLGTQGSGCARSPKVWP